MRVVVRAGARIGLQRARAWLPGRSQCTRGWRDFWEIGRVGQDAVVIDAIAGRNVHVGRGATVGAGAVLGDKTAITDYSKVYLR